MDMYNDFEEADKFQSELQKQKNQLEVPDPVKQELMKINKKLMNQLNGELARTSSKKYNFQLYRDPYLFKGFDSFENFGVDYGQDYYKRSEFQWKMHISVELDQLAKAWEVLVPIFLEEGVTIGFGLWTDASRF